MSEQPAIERWVSVHQSFFVLIQCIVLRIGEYEFAAAARKPQEKLRELVAEIATLLRASASAMRLAGSMSKQTYNTVVRPDMAGLDPKFSGLFSSDHQVMIYLLGAMRSAPMVGVDNSALKEAIKYCYDAHARVCELFVGDEPSLAGAKAGAATMSGVASLRGRYKNRTLARVDPPITSK